LTENKERPCRNIGKPEFIAARKKIQSFLKAGYDRKFIHAKLKREGLLTMSYSTFCVHFKKFKEELESTQNKIGQPASPANGSQARFSSKAAGSPAGYTAKSEPFFIDRSRSAEELM